MSQGRRGERGGARKRRRLAEREEARRIETEAQRLDHGFLLLGLAYDPDEGERVRGGFRSNDGGFQ